MRYFNVMILGPTQSPYEGSQIVFISKDASHRLLVPFFLLLCMPLTDFVLSFLLQVMTLCSVSIFVYTNGYVRLGTRSHRLLMFGLWWYDDESISSH